MITDCPDPKEIADFHFRQLRTLGIAKDNEVVLPKSVNILASSSKYGLLFIGVEGGFKVLKLENILTLDEDRENRSIERNLPYTFVKSGTPAALAVNSSQTTLAVCVRSVSGILLNLYLLSAFPDVGSMWQPFCFSPLSSSSAVELQDFSWNPAIEGLFAFCLSDGSLHVWEVAGTSLKSVAGLQTANTISVCWSPKGKQLVAGKRNGSFSQYKPTLQEVKNIPPPTFEDNPISVTSICWISTTVFAVVYAVGDMPYLCIVSTPKDSAIVYTNYNDVCLGNCSTSDQKYFLHLEPLWGILICASLDSIEIAVLGDMPNWVQWDLREDGKALLPGKDGATHAVGMTVMYSAQRQIIISEFEAYPPMPVMFIMTNNGLLVSFHMINTKSEAATLVSPPLALEFKTTENNYTADAVQKNQVLQAPQSSVASSFLPEKVSAGNQISVMQIKKSENSIIPTPSSISKDTVFSTTSQLKESSNSFGNEILIKKPENLPICSAQEKNQASNVSSTFVVAQNEVQSSTDDSYMMAIISEIQSFTKELQDLKQLQNSAPTIESEEDMISLKTFASDLHNFQNDVSQTMQSISSDIYTLKNVLLKSFEMVAEAGSRERRKNDHSYITMLKERALDPVTARRMQRMNSYYHYLRTQLQEVSDRLDQEWINLISSKKKSMRNCHVSSTEAIYKTIVNHQKIIHSLKMKVDVLMKKTEEKKLRNTTKSWRKYHKKSTQEDLSKLADEFLQVKIAFQEDGQETAVTKKMSAESQNFLKAFLKESNVVTVRPTAVYSPSQSRLLSNAVLPEDDQEKDVSPKQVLIQPLPVKGDSSVKSSVSQSAETSEVVSSSMMTSAKKSLENKSTFEPYAPIYEPITPPDPVKKVQSQGKTFACSTLVTPLSEDRHSQVLDTQVSSSFSEGLSTVVMGKDSAKQGFCPSTATTDLMSKGLATVVSSTPTVKSPLGSSSSIITCSASLTSVIPTNTNLFMPCSQTSSEHAASKPFVTAVNSSVRKDPVLSVFPPIVPEPKKTESLQSEMPGVSSCVSSSQNTTFTQPVAVTSVFSLITPATKHSIYPNHSMSLFQKSSVDANKSSSVEKESTNINFNLVNQNSVNSKPQNRVENVTYVQKQALSSQLADSSALGIETPPSTVKTSTVAATVNVTDSTTVSVLDLKPSSNTFVVSKPSVVFPQVTVENVSSGEKAAHVTTASSATNIISTTSKPSEASSGSLASLFGQTVAICSPVSSDAAAKKTESTPIFGMKSPLFGKTASSEPSFFQPTATTTPTATTATTTTRNTSADFVQTSSSAQATPFGQQPGSFTSPEGGFFSQTPSFGTPTATTTAAANPDSTFSFGKPTFGQSSGSSFGLAKSFFGQSAAAPVSESGTSSNFTFGSQNSSLVFGQGSFFGGGKPNEESKSVFGVKSPDTSNLFRTATASFGAVNSGNSFTGGSFSGGGGSVAQTGFGSFQQPTIQQPATGFGATPAFGGAPTFGSSPAFGAAPTFGSGASLSSVFGQTQVSSNFSNFANASSPTFGSLASQSPGFNNPPMASGFGSPTFGGSSFGNQTPSFGSPGSPPSNSSAFTQWRN